MRTTKHIKFAWSHETRIHRTVMRLVNSALRPVPLAYKYRVSNRLAATSPPYSFVAPGDTVIQVGAPSDTLHAGRSRAVRFALRVGTQGRVFAIEPDASSCSELGKAAHDLGIKLSPINSAAWNRRQKLNVFIDPAHPATSFTEGSKNYSPERLAEYTAIELDAAPLDELLAPYGLARIRVLSVTTNGAEREILKGARALIEGGVDFIALARTSDSFQAEMATMGYELLTHDDRGFTFVRNGGTSGR